MSRPASRLGLALAVLGLFVLATPAPGEQCVRSCPPGHPRDAAGCCAPPPPGPSPAPGGGSKVPGRFVRIKAGSFQMGSPAGEVAADDDEPLHPVTLTRDFLLMEAEVVQGDFQKVMGYNPSDHVACGPDCPAENVSWHEAAAYSNALSDLEGLPRCYACSGQAAGVACEPSSEFVKPYQCPGYRLPTEAEWEQAARAGTTTATYGGDLDPAHLACEQPNLVLDRIAWFCGNSGGAPHQVRTRDANAWGLYDMLGNVYEWCHDWYRPYDRGARTDPWGGPAGTERIVRGGSWCCRHNRDLRAAERMSEPPAERHSAMGFRVARTAP